MIQLYYGEGKGKTTAAAGAALRAAGSGRFVIFAQFMKGRESGELAVLRKLEQVRVLHSDRAFPFTRDMTEADKRALTLLHNRMLEQILGAVQERTADFIILDEITHACRFGLLDEKRLEQVLVFGKGSETELLLTGRKPPERLLEVSDYISEIRNIRHPFARGITARHGVEL